MKPNHQLFYGQLVNNNERERDKRRVSSLIEAFLFFYLYIYPPDSQESAGGANT